MDQLNFINKTLVCLQCSGSGLFKETPGEDAVVCGQCGKKYSLAGGIINFTEEGSITQLDKINYDEVYYSDLSQSIEHANYLIDRAHPLGERRYRNVLEVGSGTGYISVGLCGRIKSDTIVLSDISTKMLSVCKGKVEKFYKDRPLDKEVFYAGMDGNLFRFAPNTFDFILGHGVLHHVLNYGLLLRKFEEIMTDDGVALFVEPNFKFYQVLNFILGGLLEKLRHGKPELSKDDLSKLSSFYAGNHGSVKYSGNQDFIENLEDKYQFKREEMSAKIKEAGFRSVKVIPAFSDVLYSDKMNVHCDELKISGAGKKVIIGHVKHFEDYFLPLLNEESMSCADIYLFEKKPGVLTEVTEPPPAAPRTTAPFPEESNLKLTIDTVVRTNDGGGASLEITGWAAASKAITRITARTAMGEFSGYPSGARPDVFLHLKKDERYSAPDLICSGFIIVCRGLDKDDGISFRVEYADGTAEGAGNLRYPIKKKLIQRLKKFLA